LVQNLAWIPVCFALSGIWARLSAGFEPAAMSSAAFIAGTFESSAGQTASWRWHVLLPFCMLLPWTMIFVHGASHFMLVVVAKWCVAGRFREGSVKSDWAWFQRWLVERLVTSSAFEDFMELWVNTEVLSIFFRLLGAHIAPRVNMDFFGAVEFDLVHVERDVVFGSGVLLVNTSHGVSRRVVLKCNSCILDHSCIVAAATLPEGSLLGSYSVVPEGKELEPRTVYTGCEHGSCIALFQRPPQQAAEASDDEGRSSHHADKEEIELLTPLVSLEEGHLRSHTAPAAASHRHLEDVALRRHQSTFWFVVFNLWCVAVTLVVAPLHEIIYWSALLLQFEVHSRLKEVGFLQTSREEFYSVIFFLPLMFVLVTLLTIALVGFSKWLLVGSWSAGDRPFYSWFHFRWVALMSGFGVLSDLIEQLGGTWLAVAYLRIMGAEVGKRVCFFGHGFEYDLLRIGDDVCIGHNCDVTAHTVENMVMKLEGLSFDKGSSILSDSVIMPGGQAETWSVLLEHSQVLKGDVVPSGRTFGGLPAKLVESCTTDADCVNPLCRVPLHGASEVDDGEVAHNV